MGVNRNKALFEMIQNGTIPIKPYICIDSYNKKVLDGTFSTIRTTINSSNLHFITIIEDG